jgi:hypothetical protein
MQVLGLSGLPAPLIPQLFFITRAIRSNELPCGAVEARLCKV